MRYKRKKAKSIAELKNSNAYALAVKIKDELEKQGYEFNEYGLVLDYSEMAYGSLFCISSTDLPSVNIWFTVYNWFGMRGIERSKYT